MINAPLQSIPPKLAARPSPGTFAVAVLIFVGIAGAAVLFFFDPSKNHFYPICQFYVMTGLYCPGCGATRATYQLLHGNFAAAMHDNALFVIALAALAFRGVWFLKRRIYHQPVRFFLPPGALWAFLVAALLFAVLRNLPTFSFLAPLAS